ncbi:hypothetical protein F5X99DRAFT_408606 [Biscogniauxia marginata]|nr:hypothetical protein F5X99DRAFT_408606 [Biscogniauxia marginata]
MESTRDKALARRRAQNREAQRRFRWKQNQQKASATKPLENQGDADPAITYPAGPETLVMPALDSTNEYLSSNATSNPGSKCAFSLFGDYTLLDFLNMDNFPEPAMTEPSLAMPMFTLEMADDDIDVAL